MATEPAGRLAGLGVLIARPRRSPDPLLELLRREGCRPRVAPVMEIVPAAAPALPTQLAAALDAADLVIFVSANAVTCAVDMLARVRRSLPAAVPFFAVGRTTAAQLQRCGYQATYPPEQTTSEGLLALPSLQGIEGKNILICRGRGGRDKLRATLEERGAAVRYMEVYERRPSAEHREEINRLVAGGEVPVVVLHSGEILDAFMACIDERLLPQVRALTVLTPGPRVATLVRERGMDRVLVAANALPEKMVALLVRWYTENCGA